MAALARPTSIALNSCWKHSEPSLFDAIHHCREAVFDAVIDEVLRPSEKMPLRHLGINQFADHLFQLGKPLQAYCSLISKTASLFRQVNVSIL